MTHAAATTLEIKPMLPNYQVTVQTPPWLEPRFKDYLICGCEFEAALRAAKKAASRQWHLRRTDLVAPFVREVSQLPQPEGRGFSRRN